MSKRIFFIKMIVSMCCIAIGSFFKKSIRQDSFEETIYDEKTGLLSYHFRCYRNGMLVNESTGFRFPNGHIVPPLEKCQKMIDDPWLNPEFKAALAAFLNKEFPVPKWGMARKYLHGEKSNSHFMDIWDESGFAESIA